MIRTSAQPKDHFEGRWKKGKKYTLYAVVVNNGTKFRSVTPKEKDEPYVIYNSETETFSANAGWEIVEMSEDSRLSAMGGNGGGASGKDGKDAGFGTISASVANTSGTPSVVVETSGPDTAKNINFKFFGLKGLQGIPGISNADIKQVDVLPEASAQTTGRIYLVETETANIYARWYTEQDGNTYTWRSLGTTEIRLEDYSTKDEVSQLRQKINGDSFIDKSDTIGPLITYYILAAHTQYEGVQIYSATDFYATDYIPVTPGEHILVSVYGAAVSANEGIAFYDSQKTVVAGEAIRYLNEGTDNNDVREITIPAGAYYFRTCIKRSVSTTVVYKTYTDGPSYEERLTALEDGQDKIGIYKNRMYDNDADAMNAVVAPLMMVDWMEYLHSRNFLGTLSVLSVVSSTETSMTFSAGDAAYFTTDTIVAVRFTDGTIRYVYVKAANGTTVSRADFETADLTDAESVQSVHDTLNEGSGMHLSQYGYLGLAQFTAEKMSNKNVRRNRNWVKGIIFSNARVSPGWQDLPENKNIYTEEGELVCEPIYSGFSWGGATPDGLSKGAYVNTQSTETSGDWCLRGYSFSQNSVGGYVEFPVECTGKGIIRICAGLKPSRVTSTGRCQMTVMADGVQVASFVLGNIIKEYVAESVDVVRQYSVRFTLMDSADTEVRIHYIGFWKMYGKVESPYFNANTRVAILGDSWTQFPGVNDGLPTYPSYNTRGERPDGSSLDGLAYFEKEFARITGAVVDNWGKSNMTSENWGLVKIDAILDYARYDYVIIEFFINDHNSGMSNSTWKQNLRTICDRCRRAGATPVLMMPCMINSFSSGVYFGEMNQYIWKGLYLDSGVE